MSSSSGRLVLLVGNVLGEMCHLAQEVIDQVFVLLLVFLVVHHMYRLWPTLRARRHSRLLPAGDHVAVDVDAADYVIFRVEHQCW